VQNHGGRGSCRLRTAESERLVIVSQEDVSPMKNMDQSIVERRSKMITRQCRKGVGNKVVLMH
jgi:hypothetical protein